MSAFSLMFSIVPFFIISVFVVVLVCIVRGFARAGVQKRTLEQFANLDTLRAVAETVDWLDEDTPRSLSGMDSILLPQILADFPAFSERQVKDRAAEYAAQTLRRGGWDVSCVHNCVFSAYDRTDPERTITMQLAVELRQNGRKHQTRYSLQCRNRDFTRDEPSVSKFSCPNCGAPLQGGSGKCEYCGAFVRRPFAENWQFSSLQQI